MLRQISYVIALAFLFATDILKVQGQSTTEANSNSDEDYNDKVIIIISVAAVLSGLSLILLVLTGCGIYVLKYKRRE